MKYLVITLGIFFEIWWFILTIYKLDFTGFLGTVLDIFFILTGALFILFITLCCGIYDDDWRR